MTWEWHRLGDLLRPQSNRKAVQQGWSPRCHPNPAPEGAWGVLKTTAIQDGRFEPEHNKELPEHLVPREQIEVQAGDLLMTCAGPRARCGVPALVRQTPPRLMMSGKMYRMCPDDRVLPAFLELWLRSPDAQRRIDRMKTGISDSGLNLTHDRFVELPVPVPPLDEQRRIVAVLEDHLSRLDAAQQGVSSALRRSRALRDVALSTAVAEATRSPGVVVESLGALAKVSSGLTPLKGNRAFYDGGAIPWITSGDLHQGLITRPTQFVTQEALDSTTLKIVRSGTLLIAMYGEGKTRGTTAELGIDATTNQACAAVALHDDGLRQWVRLVLDANYSTLRRRAAGGVQPNLNLSVIKAIRIPVPCPEVREKLLVQRIELDETQSRLQTQLNAARRRGISLRRSLLAAAFSGKLTAALAVA